MRQPIGDGAPPGERELGAEAEDRHSKRTDDASASSSSGDAAGGSSPGESSSAQSKRATPAGTQGPETEERTKQRYGRSASAPTVKRTWEQSIHGPNPAAPDDWIKFDVQRSLRALRFGNENEAKLFLRKLHIR